MASLDVPLKCKRELTWASDVNKPATQTLLYCRGLILLQFAETRMLHPWGGGGVTYGFPQTATESTLWFCAIEWIGSAS